MARHPFISLLVALAVLLPPLPISAEMRRALSASRRKIAVNPISALGVWQNWVDLLRAAAGVFVLTHWALPTESATESGAATAAIVSAIVLSGALLLQSIRRVRGVQFLAPVFFLSGMTLVMSSSIPKDLQGVFAVVVAWVFALVGKHLAIQLPAMAVALGLAGYVLGFGLPLILNCLLILLPLIPPLLFRKKLLFPAPLPVS